jgi:hypothetical protein
LVFRFVSTSFVSRNAEPIMALIARVVKALRVVGAAAHVPAAEPAAARSRELEHASIDGHEAKRKKVRKTRANILRDPGVIEVER